ncbi:hypothetical protein PMAYCL1PPCAC_27874, partial [Pristionchus mayeri]
NAVRSTPERRKSLAEQLRATTKQFLCESHFLLSDFYHFPSGTRLRLHAVPFFKDVPATSNDQEDAPLVCSLNDIKVEPTELFVEVKQDEPIFDNYCPSTVASRTLFPSIQLD